MTRSHRFLSIIPMALSLGTLCPPAAVAQVAAAPTHAEQAIIDLETKRFDAQVARDVPALARVIADDAVYIHASGQTQGKADYLRDVAAGTSRYRSIEASERTAHIYGGTAVTHGVVTLNVGVDRKIMARYTGVYVRRGGQWLVLSWQTTPNAGPARQ